MPDATGRPSVGGFVLAAGEGRRLRPVTLARPKALLPFCGVPLLQLAASQLARVGLRRIVVNCCYQGEKVADAVEQLAARHLWDLAISREPRLLDTGGSIRFGARHLRDVDHILVHNADVVLDVDMARLIDTHVASAAAATAVLVPGRGPQTVSVRTDGVIGNFRRPAGQGSHTFSGVHILRREVLDLLPDRDPCSIIVAYERALASGLSVVGFELPDHGYWADLGTPQAYIRAHGEAADRAFRHHPAMHAAQAEQARRRAALERLGVRCSGALGIGAGVSVPAGGHLHNVVLWDRAALSRPLLYADGVFVGGEPEVPAPVDVERRPDPRVYACLGLEPEQCELTPLTKQGSGRRYCRMSHGDTSWIWCAYDPERRENASFSTLADFLDRLQIRVPKVELHLADVGEIVSRDLGGSDLQHETAPAAVRMYLEQVVAQIARLHVIGERAARLEELPLQNGFTKGLYDWERDYFREHVLERFLGRTDLWAAAAAEYAELRALLLREPLVPVHRDLQSANIMIDEGQVCFIDFQGMRPGCAAYDLASLLYDPYKCYPAELRQDTWRLYAECVRDLGGIPPAVDVLYAAAVQRLFQALGAYGKLWRQDGLDWYRRFIVPGLEMLCEAARESRCFPGILDLARTCRDLAREKLGSGTGPEY